MNKVISLFSGGGGLDLGFITEGFKIVWAIDSNINAVNTYKANIGDHIICEDINKIDLNILPKADIVIGGPPCQSFSLAGKRQSDDARGQLVWRYIDILKKVKPKVFLFENVIGLCSAKTSNGEKILDLLKVTMQHIGYKIAYQVINAADYGIPQQRKRIIIVGMKNKKKFIFPEPTHSQNSNVLRKYITVKEAIGDLPPACKNQNDIINYKLKPKNIYQENMRNISGCVSEHFVPKMSELDAYIVKHVKPGGNYMDIPNSVPSSRIRRLQREGGHTTCYGRMDPNKPAYTINTYFNRPNVGCNIHYKENRLITIREALRLQSFPDDYKIVSSSKQDKHVIVGNAVPPLLAKMIACELKKYIC
jgi:DNA (cytosine-5)-methyltransferase 1